MIKLPNSVTKTFGRQILLAQKNSPTIMLATGVVGVVGATVLACRATLKVEDILDQRERDLAKIKAVNVVEYTEKKRIHDLAVVQGKTVGGIAKLYAPAVGVGAISIALLVQGHRIHTQRFAGLAAAYGTVDKAFNEYRKRVVAEFGEGNDRNFMYGKEVSVEEQEDGGRVHVVEGPTDGRPSKYARIFDEFSRNWNTTPMYNQMFLKAQQQYANDLLQSRGHLFLNEVYDMLGLERSPEGQIVGWSNDSAYGDNYVDFGVFRNDVYSAVRFVNGDENSILLDFNVDGPIWNRF